MKVLAVTSVKPGSPEQLQQILPKEVPATLKLYLEGVVEQMWMRENRGGPVFLMAVETAEAAEAALARLPLVQAGLMTYELYPVGPLSALGLLIQDK